MMTNFYKQIQRNRGYIVSDKQTINGLPFELTSVLDIPNTRKWWSENWYKTNETLPAECKTEIEQAISDYMASKNAKVPHGKPFCLNFNADGICVLKSRLVESD